MPYVCEVCGREMFRKIKSHGHIFCNKHYKQLKKYGHVLDSNPRTILDKNEEYKYIEENKKKVLTLIKKAEKLI